MDARLRHLLRTYEQSPNETMAKALAQELARASSNTIGNFETILRLPGVSNLLLHYALTRPAVEILDFHTFLMGSNTEYMEWVVEFLNRCRGFATLDGNDVTDLERRLTIYSIPNMLLLSPHGQPENLEILKIGYRFLDHATHMLHVWARVDRTITTAGVAMDRYYDIFKFDIRLRSDPQGRLCYNLPYEICPICWQPSRIVVAIMPDDNFNEALYSCGHQVDRSSVVLAYHNRVDTTISVGELLPFYEENNYSNLLPMEPQFNHFLNGLWNSFLLEPRLNGYQYIRSTVTLL